MPTARTISGSMFAFQGVQNREVLSAASMDGFTATWKTNAIHAIHGVPENK